MRNITTLAMGLASAALMAQNTVNLLYDDGSAEKITASDVDSINFSTGNNFTISKSDNSVRTFNGGVRQISFSKQTTQSDELSLTTFGWLEAGCVTFNLISSASTYNVYCKASSDSDSKYVKLDAELVRNYGTYGRADVVGLSAGNYVLKVVPVDASGNELSSLAAVSDAFVVKAHDRQGYAHFGYSGVGAYNDNGTLKDGAKVIYVTDQNINTVTCDIQTSSSGGVTTGVGLGDIFALKQKGYDTAPLAVRIIGCVTLANTNSAQLLSDENGLQLKGNDGEAVMNVTLEGIGNDATFNGYGITFFKCKSVEMRNLGVMNFNDDGIQIKTCHNIWIHNNDIFYGIPGSDADQKKGDGSLDVKDDSQYGTFSYNHFFDSGKMSLCGMKGETGENWLCYHHNWFDHSDSRHPRVRTMTVHVWNNYYDGMALSLIIIFSIPARCLFAE